MYERVDVADMQCWIFRMAQKKWNLEPAECADIFKKHNVLNFIDDCYGILHLSSYECALEDVETKLRNEGVKL